MSDPREQLRRAVEDGERLYRVRMHGEGETVADGFRVDGILTRELPDALAALDACRRDLAEEIRAQVDVAAYLHKTLTDLAEERAKTERLAEALLRIAESYPWEPYGEGEGIRGPVRYGAERGPFPTNRRLAREALAECGAGTEKPA